MGGQRCVFYGAAEFSKGRCSKFGSVTHGAAKICGIQDDVMTPQELLEQLNALDEHTRIEAKTWEICGGNRLCIC